METMTPQSPLRFVLRLLFVHLLLGASTVQCLQGHRAEPSSLPHASPVPSADVTITANTKCGEDCSPLKFYDTIRASITRFPTSVRLGEEHYYADDSQPAPVYETTIITSSSTTRQEVVLETTTPSIPIAAEVSRTSTTEQPTSAVEQADAVTAAVNVVPLHDEDSEADHQDAFQARRKALTLKTENLRWTAKNRYRKLKPKLRIGGGQYDANEARKAKSKVTYGSYRAQLVGRSSANFRSTPGGDQTPMQANQTLAQGDAGAQQQQLTRQTRLADRNSTDNSINPIPTFSSRRIDEADIFELSSSETKASAVEQHTGRRPSHRSFYSSRFRRQNSTNSDSASIPKLLLPKFIRPRMYSLDGFIPKPKRTPPVTTSTTTTSTTKAPPTTQRRGGRYYGKSYHGQQLEVAASTTFKRRKVTQPTLLQKRNGRNLIASNYPAYHSIPKTSFHCGKKGRSGVFADTDAGCQVWHMCHGMRKHSFLCPNGTIFSEKAGVCDWWYNVECGRPSAQTDPQPSADLLTPLASDTSSAKVVGSGRRLPGASKVTPKSVKSYAQLIDFEALLLRSG